MSDRSGRKRRKPAKPSRHSPNSNSELLIANVNDDNSSFTISNDSSEAIQLTNQNDSFSIASQSEIDNYITDKRVRMSEFLTQQESDSRSESPQDSLDLSIGSKTQISPPSISFGKSNGSSPKHVFVSPEIESIQTKVKKEPTSKTLPVPLLNTTLSATSQTLLPMAPSTEIQSPERSIMTQYEELKSKAMTSRARRVIANARERNRVHTISSAFEQLRKSIPCYSGNQKLSKLAILKIAASYIRCLSHVAAMDCDKLAGVGGGSSKDSKLSELVMRCTVNVLSDGKLKRPEVTGSGGSIERMGASDCEDELD